MSILRLDSASNVLEHLRLNTKWGKKRLKKDPFTVCKLFGHAKELFWEASDRYWKIADSPAIDFGADERKYIAYKAALDQAEADYQAWGKILHIRAEVLGLMRPRG